jgi:hypothetical protein
MVGFSRWKINLTTGWELYAISAAIKALKRNNDLQVPDRWLTSDSTAERGIEQPYST